MTSEKSAHSSDLPRSILERIAKVCGPNSTSLHEPQLGAHEIDYVVKCIESNFVSSVGEFVNQFEDSLSEYTGAKYAVATVNGTAALHIALLLAGVRPGDEVLMPAMTFVATANAVKYCQATPHFIDVDRNTLGVDVLALKDWLKFVGERQGGVLINKLTKRPIRAILPMHTFGHSVDMCNLLSLAHDNGVVIVEDAAEALGSFYQGKHLGTMGLLGILSFNGNKIITTGGGGAILTNNATLAIRAKHITTTAKISHPWLFDHDEVGFNYRMPNINAALGCAQLNSIESFLISKRALYGMYEKVFQDLNGVSLFKEPQSCHSNYWLQTLILDSLESDKRDTILQLLNSSGYMARPVWTLLNRLPPYIHCQRSNLEQSEKLEKAIINIPSSAGMV